MDQVVVLICVCGVATTTVADEEQKTAIVVAGQTKTNSSGSVEREQVDPYQVPDGSIDELFEYLQAGPRLMQPRTRDDAVRMFQSLDSAAIRIYNDKRATVEERVRSAGWRVMLHNRLEALGVSESRRRLRRFLDRAAADPAPEMQQFARQTILDQKISKWSRLDAAQREAVLRDIRSGLTGERVELSNVMGLLKLADTVAETPAAPQIVALIEEVLPTLESIEAPAIAERLPRLKGMVRRLQLPGNKMEVEGTLLGGETLDWESYRGKVVLVDYWATWCEPCVDELHNVKAAYESYHERGFDVLGISLDTDNQAVENFVETRNLPWQTLFHRDYKRSDEPWDHPMAEKYAIGRLPWAVLVDRQGNVVKVNARGRALRESLEDLLGPAEMPTGAVEPRAESAKTAAVDQ